MKLADLNENWKAKVKGVPSYQVDVTGDKVTDNQFYELNDRAMEERRYDDYFTEYFDEVYTTSTRAWATSKEVKLLKDIITAEGGNIRVVHGWPDTWELAAKIKEMEQKGYRQRLFGDVEPAEIIMTTT